MVYFEDLPHNCPPSTAEETDLSGYRLVHHNPPTVDDFKSHAAKGLKKPPTVGECEWASCSILPQREQVASISKLPKYRDMNNFIAKVEGPAGIGKLQIKSKHIDFWLYNSVDPLRFVTKVEDSSAT